MERGLHLRERLTEMLDLETDPHTRVRNPCPKSETSLLYSPGAGDLD
jgi:hypothetical protein